MEGEQLRIKHTKHWAPTVVWPVTCGVEYFGATLTSIPTNLRFPRRTTAFIILIQKT